MSIAMTSPAKTRVLFVDDEALVLNGLQRMLRPLCNQWEMTFVDSGAKALEAMGRAPFGVVVSDMRMPSMNGAQLLSEISRSYPKTVRIILSGHADKTLIVQCVGTAHQFLSKPCEPEELKAAVARASRFEQSVNSETLKELIAKLQTLPSVPSLFHKVMQKLRDENCSLEDVSDIIASDPGMTAKLLKLVNSAFFGLRRQVSNPLDAVTLLGLDTIKALVLAVNAFSCFEDTAPGPLNIEGLWNHSMAVANWARSIAKAENATTSQVDECFTSGMLHDIGKLALSANLPDAYRKTIELAKSANLTLYAAEEQVFGANHADVGGYLLSLWGLPARIVDAIAFHHDPFGSVVEGFGALAAVHAANAFANELEENSIGAKAGLDKLFFEQRGFSAQLQIWKSLKA